MKKLFLSESLPKKDSGRKQICRVMKLTASFLLLCSCFVFAGHANSQNAKVSLNKNRVQLQEVLDEIESQTDYLFISNRDLDLTQKVSVRVKDKSVQEVLEKVLENAGLTFTMEGVNIILSKEGTPVIAEVQQQRKKITGTIIDQNGEPVIGANIVEKGTTNGTVTDIDGKYSLEVSVGSMLSVSYIGYVDKEIKVGKEATIDIRLAEDTQALDEVVVVGYSSKSQSQLSSSVSVVSKENLRGVNSENVSKMLQGKSSGVVVSNGTGQPGSTPSIIIRGTGSIGAGTSPLYVVDGVIGGTANPNDIESISILKDAAATGLYGSRAANGVIIITTKSGKSGKTKINLDSSFGYGWKPNSNLKMMDSQQFYDFHKTMHIDRYNTQYASVQTKPTLDEYLNEKLPLSLLETNTDWRDLHYRTAPSHNHSLSISGGGEKTQFYASLNYYNEKGIFLQTGYEQYNFRANLKHKINSKITLSVLSNSRYSKKENNSNGDAFWDSYVLLPWDNPWNEDGTMKSGTEDDWMGRHKRNSLYPLQWNYNHVKTKKFSTDVKLDYSITDWLRFSTTNRGDSESSVGETYYDKRTVQGANSKGELTVPTTDMTTILTSNLLTASKNFNKHSISGILGYEYQKSSSSNVTSTGKGIEPGFSVLDVSAEAKSVGGTKNESVFSSVFFQGDYSYDNKYFLVASYRRDGSSRFGNENRYGNFYSIGGSWLMNKESFLSSFSNLDLLKLRLSYGTTGNANIPDFLAYGIYNYDNQYNNSLASYPAQMANPYLTWEIAHTLNVGFDVSVFKRIRLELDAYQRTNKDLLQDVPLSSASGFTSQKRNVGSVRNRGVDLNLHTNNLVGTFSWNTDLNFSLNRNKVLKLNKGQSIISGNTCIQEGRELGYFYMREWAGVDPQTGAPLWVSWLDENGNVINEDSGIKPTKVETTSNYNEASLLYIAPIHPDFTIGFRNQLAYKGFELDFLFNFVKGGNVYNSSRELIDSDGSQATQNQMNLMDDWNRWEKPGDIATHPKPILDSKTNSNKASSRYIESTTHLRLQNITFSYTFPHDLVKKVSISNLRLFVSGDNLLLITGYSGEDPEFNYEGNGSSGWQYPSPRKVFFGINLEF